jgi:endonuclease G
MGQDLCPMIRSKRRCSISLKVDDVSILGEQIKKAERRAEGLDLRALADAGREKAPSELATPQALDERYHLLAETLGDRAQARDTFERLIAGDELQPVNYLPHGVVAARSVCRLSLSQPRGYATSFLIAPGVLLTNNHVFPTAESAQRSIAEFDLELDVLDRQKTPNAYDLRPDRLFLTSRELDFSIVAVHDVSRSGAPLTNYGFLPLINATGKAVEGEWLTIIQHPGGGPKQLCIRENKLLTRTDEVLWYSTDTLGGSSGSPVFNNDWQVVALHHKGIPETKNGVIQTIDGRDYDPGRDVDETTIKWIANEGIRISRLVDELRKLAPDEAMLEPVFGMTPARARAVIDSFARGTATPMPSSSPAPPVPPSRLPIPPARIEPAMATRSVTLTLDIADDGQVSVRQPGFRAQESLTFEKTRSTASTTPRPPEFDVPFDQDYSATGHRKGFNPGFIGKGFEVPLPELGALAAEAAPLLAEDPRSPVLDYHGYSVVMHAKRKFAIYSAANVDGGNRFKLGRPHDEWRYDPRIARSAQIGDFYYANNQFDRGHLTRYEDMEYGDKVIAALQSAADTLHFTNCSPQHAKFNQGKQLWQGLEQHVLEQSIKSENFAANIFTGPVLDAGDPVWDRYKDIQYPLQFWKIAIAQTSANKLFAAGFILDQSEVIAQFGIEATVEVPFSAFKTYQVPIAEIERLTGLSFKSGTPGKLKSLSEADPLRSGSAVRAAVSRRRIATTESTTATALPPGYIPLDDQSDIIIG